MALALKITEDTVRIENREKCLEYLRKHKVDVGEVTKRKGPFYPRRADLLFKRCVKGMIPRYTTTGREAYRALHVFVGVPKQFEAAEKVKVDVAVKALQCKYVTLGEISEFLGSKIR